ncbi:hypothetical protein I5907_15005 [Panacibacter sp. DH6]|uniref:Adhesin domain-containing protein n=1 Tax=Panacibacter microcysteis TaxID=2793269 RepID=A0A931EBI6_9BACT|nr:hypothetical protein [Panacibacter microcysteis]MBG9377551.1 hypothetical protein [Panacibacter microcysteis]
MKKYLLFLLAASSTAFTVNAQDSKEPYLTQSLSTETIKQVNVETSGGSIAVSGTSAGEARIEMWVNANNMKNTLSKEEIKKRLEEDYVVKINVSGNTLTATAKNKSNNWDWKRSLSISFKIYVPSNVSTDLSTSGGSIKLSELNGSQNFRTSGGSLKIDKVSGRIDGKTSGGSITVTNCSDNIDLSTSGGSITADNCKGSMELSTSGGSLHLSNLDGTTQANTSGGRIDADNIKGKLSASTSGGSVHLSNIRGTLETSTSGGSMDIQIAELGEYVKVSNSGGGIDIILPANKGLDVDLHGNRVKVNPMNNFSGDTDDNSIRGTMNGGGTPVKVHAGSGHVNVTFK